jgi:hypothetical protein
VRATGKGFDLSAVRGAEKEEGRIGKDLFPYPDRGMLRSCPTKDSSLSSAEKLFSL